MVASVERPDTKYGEMQDRLRQTLLSYGTQDVFVTIDDLIGRTRLSYPQIYQTLYRLQNLGELTIYKDNVGGSQKVTGVRLLKMEPEEKIEQRQVERENKKEEVKDFQEVSSSIPHTVDYLRQKTAVEKARLQIIESNTGLVADEVIAFNPNPLGEEALYLLKQLQDTLRALTLAENDREAEKRNAESWKRKFQEISLGGRES